MSLFGNFGNTGNTNTGGGLFGSTNTQQQQPQQQQQQQQQPSLFGGGATGTTAPLQAQPTLPSFAPTTSTAGTTNPTTGGGLFGSTNTAAAGGGGLFGGGAFGNQANQQQQPAMGGGLFGNTQQQQQPAQSTGGGLFGNTNTAATQNTGGGLFGGTGQNTNAGGGLFGNTTTNQQQGQQQMTGGGLFGSTATQQPTAGGLFGSTSQQPNTGGGLFGNAQQQQQGTNATAGGLFGRPAGGGLFGSTATGATGGLFGNQQPQQQQQSSLYGNQLTSGNAGGSLFGTSKGPLGMSALGGQTSTGLGGSTLGASSLLASRSGVQNAGADQQNQFASLTERVEGIYNAWNPSSPQCRFQHAFYNLVDPNQVNLYGRPPNVLNDAIWEKAVRENPDRKCFVPVIAIGFDNLRERVDAQNKQSEDHAQKLSDLKTRLASLSTKHAVSNVSRIQRASMQQTQITHRLLGLIQHLHLLIPAVRSSAIRPEEERLRGRLEEVEEEVRKGRVKAKLNELWAVLGAVTASIERGRSVSGGEWAVVDEDGMTQIVQVLKEQQIGLAHLTSILLKNQKDMAIVVGQANSDDLQLNEGETLWNSTSTLRASALR